MLKTQRQSARNFKFQLLEELERYSQSAAALGQSKNIEYLISYLDQTADWQGDNNNTMINFCILCTDEANENVLLEWSEKRNTYILPWHCFGRGADGLEAVQHLLMDKYHLLPLAPRIERLCNVGNSLETPDSEDTPQETVLCFNLVFAARVDQAIAAHPLLHWKKITDIRAAPTHHAFHPNLIRMLATY